MLVNPKFKDHFHVVVSEPKDVFLLSEKGHFALSGRLYSWLAPLLDGHHTFAQIVEELKGQATEADINYALKLLEGKGYITEADDALPPEVAAFCSLLNVAPTEAGLRLQATKVAVTALSNIPTEKFISTLRSLNICVSDEGDFAVVLTDDYLQLGLDAFNREALQAQKPWLLVKPVGGAIWIGPLFVPGKTGCWECLAQRLQGNREIESSLQEKKGIVAPFPVSRSVLPSTLQTAFNMAATEIVKWLIAPDQQQLEGKIVTFDLVNFNLQHHTLVRRPQCSCCGDPDYFHKQQQQPLVIASHKKLFAAGGGYRSCPPEETLRRYEHHISPITGVIRTLFNPLVGVNDLIHAYVANHSFPREGNDLEHLRRVGRPKSFGKGKTDIQAKTSCLGEVIERYSGTYTGNELRIKGKYSEMGEAAIHLNALMNYSESQYRTRQEWNQQHHLIQWVTEPFDEEREIEWTPVWSLTAQTFKYVPTAYCYYGYPLPQDYSFCWSDSNGNATGNTREEAILQGFMELVERDAIALWWYNRISRPAVDIESFNDPYLPSLKFYYKTLHRDLWVLDITSDLDIPTFIAISRRTNKQPEDILFGCGTHFDAKIALMRAVTELNQMVFLSNAGSPQGKAIFNRQDMQSWCETATLENHPYLAPNKNARPKVYSQYPRYWSDDLRDDVFNCVEISAKHGLEILVLDQTRPDIGMNVVKVMVPGLRHCWARFASGRLYDVPVKLGWLKAPLSEYQLNPLPTFI